jgi:phenylpropionate dioxygenase-like ring-hydroxylating dioxygenase large terminal subunit
MLSVADNERITRVGPGTPMGEVMRRYWLPALLATEVAEPDSAPVRVRLLGEDLIAYRDSEGRVGLVDAFCPHRRAPMFFGRNEDCGLRCVYHGWKFDRDGACVDMPSEPPDSLFKSKVRITAYPTWEGGGLIWAYLGPPDRQPPYPDFEFVRAPETHRFVSKTFEDCNYLQALEGGLDSSHATIMHNQNIGDGSFLRNYDALVPRIDVERTPYGYNYTGIRARGEDTQWVRLYHYVMPVTQIRGRIQDPTIPNLHSTINGHFWVPLDDTHTATYNWMYAYDPAQPVTPEYAAYVERYTGRGPEHLDPNRPFRSLQTIENDYLIDRAAQKTKTFTGITGISTQDVALQEGMGPIVDRSREHLGTTDRAIIVMRQLLLEAIDDVSAGRSPRGTDAADYRDIRALDHLIPKSVNWQDALKDERVARF